MNKITDCSEYVEKLIRHERSAVVHSVYNHTINMVCNNRIISIQSKSSPFSPLTMRTNCTGEDLSNLNITPKTEANITLKGIYIDGTFFKYQYEPSRNCNLLDFFDESKQKSVKETQDISKKALKMLDKRDGFCDIVLDDGVYWQLSDCAKTARDIIQEVRKYIKNNETTKAVVKSVELIGLGQGLTPSGDDFICGMLAACKLVNTKMSISFFEKLSERVLENLYKTNDISASFLRCSVELQFGEAVLSILTCDYPDSVAKAFDAVGHSSGADILSGIVFAFDCFETV